MSSLLSGFIGAITVLVLVVFTVVVRKGFQARARELAEPRGSKLSPELKTVVQALEIGAFVVDDHDEILICNDAGRDLGLVRGTRVGFRELLELIRKVRADEVDFKGRLVRARTPVLEGGSYCCTLVRLPNEDVLGLLTDDTVSRRIESVRRDFVANVSHELKTPIGAIGILAETLEIAADDPTEVKHFASRLQREAKRLSELVSQIIALSRLQSSDPMLSREVVEVGSVLEEALDRTRAAAQVRNVNLIRAPHVASVVRGDREQLIDAVVNLVQNAIAYSDKNSRVALTVIRATHEGEKFVDIKIADNGIGIKAEDLERIFERFYRVDYGRSRDHGGTGLGLAIVRHIAEAHGGRVSVWSKPNQGSTFTLSIPAHLEDSEPNPQEDR